MCSMCFTQKHKQHTFKHIEDVIVSQKRYLCDQLDTLKSNLDQFNYKLAKREQVTRSFKDDIDEVGNGILCQRSMMKAEVDSMAESLMVQLGRLLQEEFLSSERDCWLHWKNITEMKELIRAIEEEIEHSNGVSSLMELTERLKTAISLPNYVTNEDVFPCKPRHFCGQLNQTPLKSMLGYVHLVDESKDVIRYKKKDIDRTQVQRISLFKVPRQKTVNSICPINDKRAWVAVSSSTVLSAINKAGKVTEKVKLKFVPWYLALSKQADVLMTSYNASSLIYKLSKTRRVTTFADNNPFNSHGISVSDSDEVVVSTNSPTILVLNKFGDRIREISSDGKAQSIVCLTTGQVAVTIYNPVAVVTTYCNKLVVTGMCDKTILSWRDDLDKDKKNNGRFLCGIGRDMYDRVFVPDVSNDQVYVVSGDGKKTTCLLDERHKIRAPGAIGVDMCGHVWIGCLDGNIHVIQL
ncbi:uncharacterized protein LOC117341819 [Pecten maximus]|uniref:uncharacterized protein LOC117341819 n=1 Tax=Pecten maximus TaxID=6579 RepID=UPI0014589170|nr:uncharacterized protein LOC117341819 [Pecten maximus]